MEIQQVEGGRARELGRSPRRVGRRGLGVHNSDGGWERGLPVRTKKQRQELEMGSGDGRGLGRGGAHL